MFTMLQSLKAELGISSILNSSRDAKILCLQRFLRLFAYGASIVVLALYLASLGVSEARIGLFMTLTLLGDVLISVILTLVADGLGRRKVLVVGAGLMSVSGVVFALSGNYWVLLAASIFGVISPSGSEIGPFRAIEESTLAQLTPSEIRSDIFAWYMLLGLAGAACGTATSGWIVSGLRSKYYWTDIHAYRFIFGCYAVLGLVKLLLSLNLSEKCEPQAEKRERQDYSESSSIEAEGLLSEGEEAIQMRPNRTHKSSRVNTSKSIWPNISPSSRKILLKLCLLFAVDSFASGLVPQSWMTYFFNKKFSLPEGQLGTLFFTTNIVGAISNLVASSISKRIGLIKTMVFTHLPSAIFLALIPIPNNVVLAMTFLVLRASVQSMDQAPRQAFLAAVVLPSERTAVMGVVNVVKTLSQSGGPVTTGWLAGMNKFWVSFLVAGGLKASYDLAMLRMFLGHKTHDEEVEAEAEAEEEEEVGNNDGHARRLDSNVDIRT